MIINFTGPWNLQNFQLYNLSNNYFTHKGDTHKTFVIEITGTIISSNETKYKIETFTCACRSVQNW